MTSDVHTATLLYVYGVAGETELPEATGIAGARVTTVAAGDVVALISELPQLERVALGRDELTAHASVLDAAHRHGPVLPMRFGVVMESEAAIREQLLEPHRDSLRAQLAAMEGKSEMRLRATYAEETLMREVVAEERGIAELRERIRGRPDDATYYERIRLGELVAGAVARKRERDTAALLERLTPLALDTAVAEPQHERVALSASFLVETGRLEEFDTRLEEIGREQAGRMRLKATGPLPPYSFVELGQGGEP